MLDTRQALGRRNSARRSAATGDMAEAGTVAGGTAVQVE